MADSRAGLGQLGERLAADYLEQRGYVIRARNFRWRFGEIDLIAERDGLLVFVEVRTRRGDAYGDPAATLTPAKQERLRATAEYYCQQTAGCGPDRRIDLIAVRFAAGGRLAEIEHYESAVEG